MNIFSLKVVSSTAQKHSNMFLKGTFNKSNSIENVVMGFKWILDCYWNIQEKMNRQKSKIILMAVSFFSQP